MVGVLYYKIMGFYGNLNTFKNTFKDDLIAGITVAVVAIPLALAFGIASGVGAAAGLYSAIIAGIAASIFGGSKFQITGPTGGMVAVLVFVVATYGPQKALIAGLLAGIFQIIFGLAKLGKLIKFVPFSVTTGFTAGIAVVIALSQKSNIITAPLIVAVTIAASFLIRKFFPKLPASLIVVILVTIGVKFAGIDAPLVGKIPSSLPIPKFPDMALADIKGLFKPALILAALGSIESLMSAVVADGMTVDEYHDSNKELIGQGIGNIAAPLFGGIAATGAIARTAVNINAGARTRLAGVIHGLIILLLMLAMSPLAAQIPLGALAGVLIVAAIRMVEWKNVVLLYRSSQADLAIMILTLLITIFIDLVTAIEIGLIAAGMLFVYRMSDLGVYRDDELDRKMSTSMRENINALDTGIVTYRVDGPLFFGAAEKFIKLTVAHPSMKVLILRMKRVPMIDTSGIVAIQTILNQTKYQDSKFFLSGSQEQVARKLRDSGIIEEIGEENIFANTEEAINAARKFISKTEEEKLLQSPSLC